MRRASSLAILLAVLGAGAGPVAAQRPPDTYVLVHGAWGGSWDWRGMDSMLTARGHRVLRVALTGLGERTHLASPGIGLSTHVDDVANAILWENVRDVVLVGHSYGGMVVTGVVDRIPDRIRHVVYLDAFLPDSGESVLGLIAASGPNPFAEAVQGGMIVPRWVRDTTVVPRDVPQSLRTFTDTLRLVNPAGRRVPGTYILTVDPAESPDTFERFAGRAAARGWPVHRLAADHNPQRSTREALLALLLLVP